MLFLQSAVDKMDPERGRAAIIENGSPLYTGEVGSGESQIRRWLLEQDLIEAIIALPVDLFYNTGIATYIWILSKNKRAERKGKVQLIDASQIFHKLRKGLGKKKNEITPDDREHITRLYADFAENDLCQIYPNEEFIYREYTVMQPLQRSYGITEERIENLINGGYLNSLFNPTKVAKLEQKEELTAKEERELAKHRQGEPLYTAIIDTLRAAITDQVWLAPKPFTAHLKSLVRQTVVDSKLLAKIADGLSLMDKSAEIQRDRKGNTIYDTATKDVERVPAEEDITEYMQREVLPYIPDAKAFFEEDLSKKKPVVKTGAEIPFTRYFYSYETPVTAEIYAQEFMRLEQEISASIVSLFGGRL